YLQSKTWWLGIILLILGEMGNFLAYGFAPASTIATLGITTLVSNAILAPCLLNEQFRTRDFFGVLFAVCGAAAVVWSSKSHDIKLSPELVVAYLTQMRSFLFYIITISLIVFLSLISPQYGASNIFIDLGIVALYGAYTVLSTKSLSSLVNLTLYNLFTYPISYILIIVLVFTAIMQIKYLNKALQRFDGVAVIPTQFVLFTISAIIGSAVIYHDFDNDDIGNFIKFIIGCTIEFFGVFLITSNRRKENQHSSSPNLQSTSIIIHSPPPSIHVTDQSNNNNNNNIPSITTPLLNPHYDDVEHQSIYSGRRSSIIGGISLHSHLTTQEGDN
ncbi:magnesium transporter NIPA-domain-containing protein, partial [Cunninghamella echinulata]